MITRYIVDFQTNEKNISKEFTYADDAACYALGLLRNVREEDELHALTLTRVEYKNSRNRLFGRFCQKTGLWNFWHSDKSKLELLAKGCAKSLISFEM